MTEAAADLLRAYREVPTAQLALSGYLDIKGNVWGAIVRDGRGWVDMVTVAADAGDASCRASGSANNGVKGGVVKCMMSCVRNLLSRPSNTPSSPWRCYRLCWRLRGFGALAPMGAWRHWSSGQRLMASFRRRLSMPRRVPRTSLCIDIACEDRAQSTVEAAFLLPTFLTLILLALQPVCLLYTRAVMESAAAETARLMTTTTVEGDDDLKEFTRRRLAAVPNVSIFHAGGPLSWDIELGRAGASGVSSVSVAGEVKPLPVIGAFARAMGSAGEGGYVELKVDVSYRSRPEWLEGDYDSWIATWD